MKPSLLWLLPATMAAAAPDTPPDPEDAAYPAIERFVEVLETVRNRHPDTDLLSYDRLVNHALEGMLGSLDPHSSFIHPEMAAALKQNPDIDTTVPSLGLTFGLRENGPYITSVAPGSPAAQSGILPGAGLLEIDGNPVANTPITEWIPALRRPGGSLTTLGLQSKSNPKPETHTLTHRHIESRSVAESRLLDQSSVGYLRLALFGTRCAAEVEAALDELEDAGMQSLLLDLRGNPGGSLRETVDIIGLFVPPDTAVVTTRSRGKITRTLRTPSRQRRKRDYPIAILIDRDSASASELTAAALRDLNRASLIGETSYGKGSVQNIVPTGGGTALRLTIATYHTPSGETPHRKGVSPDIPIEITDEIRSNYQDLRRAETLPPRRRTELESWRDPVIAAALESLSK